MAWEPAGGQRRPLALARDLGIGTGEQRELGLVRDDHGGVLLHHGRIEAGRRRTPRRWAGGWGCRPTTTTSRSPTATVTRIDVRPDWRAVDTIGVT